MRHAVFGRLDRPGVIRPATEEYAMRSRRKLTLCTLSLSVGLLFFPLSGAAAAATVSHDDDMHWSNPLDAPGNVTGSSHVLPTDMHWILLDFPDDMHW